MSEPFSELRKKACAKNQNGIIQRLSQSVVSLCPAKPFFEKKGIFPVIMLSVMFSVTEGRILGIVVSNFPVDYYSVCWGGYWFCLLKTFYNFFMFFLFHVFVDMFFVVATLCNTVSLNYHSSH